MVALGVSLQSRDFSYNDDAFQVLRPYELGSAPALSGELRWYPVAHFSEGFLTHIGVEGRVRYLVGVSSEDSEGNELRPTARTFSAGSAVASPSGASELGLALGLGHHSFSVEVPEEGPQLPDVGYTYLRIGADSRFELPADLQLYIGGRLAPGPVHRGIR